jgi:hypothetical protein
MAFCPNCGTPNTDQVEKCVACGFELTVPKQKAKFKGTIMMSGLKAPGSGESELGPQAPPADKPAEKPLPAPLAPPPADTGRNPNYAKTMMGHAPVVAPGARPPVATPGPRPAVSTPTPPASATPPSFQSSAGTTESDERDDTPELSFDSPHGSGSALPPVAATVEPVRQAPAAPARISSRDSSGSGSFVGSNAPRQSASVGGYDSTLPPSAPPSSPKPAKIIAIGCAVALALFCVVGGILYYVVGEKIKALMGDDDSEAEATAWQASIVQSLAQVSELCKSDCTQAGVYFHPQREAALLGEAKALTPERLLKLSDSAQTKATMLDGSDDEKVATELGLDPQQCARVSVGSAVVISCSVPDPTGKPSVLRIVQLAGLSTL